MTEASSSMQTTNSREPLGYIIGGLAILALGGAIFGSSFMSEYDYVSGETTSDGGGLFFGAAVMAIGQLLALIGVIAQGVKIGNRSSQSR